VTRGPHRHEGCVRLPGTQALDRVEASSGSESGGLEGRVAHGGIGVEWATSHEAVALERVDVGGVVDRSDRLSGGRRGREESESLLEARSATAYCSESFGSLGVPRPRVVIGEALVRTEEDDPHNAILDLGLLVAEASSSYHETIGSSYTHSTPEPATVHVGGRSVRLSPWYGFEGAVLIGMAPSLWLRDPTWLSIARQAAQARGWRRFLVQATSLAQREVLEAAGWQRVDELFVLFRSGSRPIPPVPPTARGVELRRGRHADVPELLEVDHRCFEPFWAMNEAALREALGATPRTRFRVLTSGTDDRLVGYAIFGLGAGEGYLQRIAIDPGFQGRGLATRLIVDGLRWAKRWRARRVGVNTQRTNETALRLYQHLGFVVEPEGITIYAWPE